MLRYGDLEIRDYPPAIVAETRVEAGPTQALRAGFRRLARYLLGANSGPEAQASPTPALEGRRGERIEMTAPVSHAREDGAWVVGLQLPERFTMETAPQPVDDRVRLRRVPARRVAVLPFSGRASPRRVEAEIREALRLVEGRLRRPVGAPVLAQYDPPWKPFGRRNEILVEIEP